MLTQLSIRNVVLIEKLDVAPCDGFMVLTGETGAGKSILLDALSLGLGERAGAGLVRKGAEQASVSLTFDLPTEHPLFAQLQELGLAPGDSGTDVILRRIVGKDGRSRAFVNDEPVAINILKRLGTLLIEIHGQFETHGLLQPATHGHYLDAYAGLVPALRELEETYTAWKNAARAHAEQQKQAAEAARRADDIRISLLELQKLAPQPGEADRLSAERIALQGREKIMEALQSSSQELQGDQGAMRRMATARRILARASEKAPDVLAPILEQLDGAENSLTEAIESLNRLAHGTDYSATTLEKIEERLFSLRAAGRKYQCLVDDLPTLLDKLSAESALLDNADKNLGRLQKEAEDLKIIFEGKARSIHEARGKAAKKLENAVSRELPPLKLEGARFVIAVEELPLEEAGPQGISRTVFMAATNPGMPPSPLHKIASGGELARFMLALRLCLTGDTGITTLVFDEIDTGIGGATASAVGERLARLGKTLQTLVVTHSPQVAARADQHWHISKSTLNGATVTKARQLSEAERHEEIARMLAGDQVTPAARQAAESLMQGSAADHAGGKRRAS